MPKETDLVVIDSLAHFLPEMGYYEAPDDLDRRHRLVAFSRYDETPRHLLLELQADGDYAVLQKGWRRHLARAGRGTAQVQADTVAVPVQPIEC